MREAWPKEMRVDNGRVLGDHKCLTRYPNPAPIDFDLLTSDALAARAVCSSPARS